MRAIAARGVLAMIFAVESRRGVFRADTALARRRYSVYEGAAAASSGAPPSSMAEAERTSPLSAAAFACSTCAPRLAWLATFRNECVREKAELVRSIAWKLLALMSSNSLRRESTFHRSTDRCRVNDRARRSLATESAGATVASTDCRDFPAVGGRREEAAVDTPETREEPVTFGFPGDAA